MLSGISRTRRTIKRGTVASSVALTLIGSMLAGPNASQAHVGSKPGLYSPCVAPGHGPGAIPAISFGRKGGNIRPLTVQIYGDGAIKYSGAAQGSAPYSIQPDAVQGLERLAQAEGFASWPAKFTSTHLFPDVATLFITLRAGCLNATKTVSLPPGANAPQYRELWDTLLAASGLGLR
jgi:hypothetical protein